MAKKFCSVLLSGLLVLLHQLASGQATREIHPISGPAFESTYVWDGRELEPKSGGSFNKAWVVESHVPILIAALVAVGKARRWGGLLLRPRALSRKERLWLQKRGGPEGRRPPAGIATCGG